MAVSDGATMTVFKEMGLVSSVFDEKTLVALEGDLGIGHVRYSTTGASDWQNAQPVYRSAGTTGFALAHNGNLTNTDELTAEAGMLPGLIDSDSTLVAELIARQFPADLPHLDGDAARFERPTGLNGHGYNGTRVPQSEDHDLESALCKVLPLLEGAFSFVIADATHVVGVRDPYGFRPLCLGRLDHGPDEEAGYVLASESPALDIVGAQLIREVEPGEMVVIDANGIRSVWPFPERAAEPRLCAFEFVYFARPDTILNGQEVHSARRRMGELLAEQAPVEADLVMGVPDSGTPAAEGYSRQSKIPFGHGLVKNRYIGRTFIAPTQAARDLGVRRKFNPLRANVMGKRLIVIDDSIVRGTTTRQLVHMLREAGAKEVHLRISSPPFRWPCFYGIDTPDRAGLLAANTPLELVAGVLDADSVEYLSLENLLTAIGGEDGGYCLACLTGDYPTDIPAGERSRLLSVV